MQTIMLLTFSIQLSLWKVLQCNINVYSVFLCFTKQYQFYPWYIYEVYSSLEALTNTSTFTSKSYWKWTIGRIYWNILDKKNKKNFHLTQGVNCAVSVDCSSALSVDAKYNLLTDVRGQSGNSETNIVYLKGPQVPVLETSLTQRYFLKNCVRNVATIHMFVEDCDRDMGVFTTPRGILGSWSFRTAWQSCARFR